MDTRSRQNITVTSEEMSYIYLSSAKILILKKAASRKVFFFSVYCDGKRCQPRGPVSQQRG